MPAVRLRPSGQLDIDHEADQDSAAPSAEWLYLAAEQALFRRASASPATASGSAETSSGTTAPERAFESVLAGLLRPEQTPALTPATPALQTASLPAPAATPWLRTELLSLVDPPTVAFALLALLLVPLRRSRRRTRQPLPPAMAALKDSSTPAPVRHRRRLSYLPVASTMR